MTEHPDTRGSDRAVLCVVAHPDDEVLGVGGTLASHAEDGDDVEACFLSDGVTSRYDEIPEDAEHEIDRRQSRAREACEQLGVNDTSFERFPDNQFDTVPLLDLVQTVEKAVERIEPDVIYTHHHGDLNVDHELTARAVLTAARPLADSPVSKVLGFETLSSTEWATPEPGNAFQPTVFRDISSTIDAKLDALRVYKNELREHPHPRTVENVEANARLWGAKSGVEYAEPFVHLREVVERGDS